MSGSTGTGATNELVALLERDGYLHVRKLRTGEMIGLQRLIFTVGLCVGLDRHGYRTRFCYPTMRDALFASLTWDGEGDPPGPWIKEKGMVERNNPRALGGVPIVVESARAADNSDGGR